MKKNQDIHIQALEKLQRKWLRPQFGFATRIISSSACNSSELHNAIFIWQECNDLASKVNSICSIYTVRTTFWTFVHELVR